MTANYDPLELEILTWLKSYAKERFLKTTEEMPDSPEFKEGMDVVRGRMLGRRSEFSQLSDVYKQNKNASRVTEYFEQANQIKFEKLVEAVTKNTGCTFEELNATLAMLALEGLLEVSRAGGNNATGYDISQAGLVALRNL